jgi:hypothetical protein
MSRLLAALLVLLVGCTGPVRSYPVYASKAAKTAETEASAVGTARLAVGAALARKSFGRTLAQILTDAAADASSAQGIFDAIQPPDRRADRLRSSLDDLLDQTVATLQGLVIAARRGDTAALSRLAAPLADLAGKLDDFAKAHQ